MDTAKTNDVDVIILGGSLSASTLALTLSAQGVRVALIDGGSHPRFALGESLLKPTVLWMRLLARKFSVPALEVVADLERISTEIAPTSGVKRCFGFVKHVPGQHRVGDQWFSNVPVSYGEPVLEGHLFRQDIDAYLFGEAALTCSMVESGLVIDQVELNEQGVTVSAGAKTIRASYVVDCGGGRSLLAGQLGLREDPPRWLANSRSNFTHLIGVRNFEDCDAAPLPGLDWSNGTLHHLLDDAWIWVIPFDNYERSKNPRVSVGVTFYGSRAEKSALSPQQEWNELLGRYPALAAQFGEAVPVRPWIGTPRLEYSSTTAIGERFCLLGQAYGGIDALFSRGLLNTMQCINLVTEMLCAAVRNNDFSTASFAPLQSLQDNLLEINDLLAHGSYLGFESSKLTTWWLSLWTQIEQLSIKQAQGGLDDLDMDASPSGDMAWSPASAVGEDETVLTVLRDAAATMEEFAAGSLTDREVSARLSEQAAALTPFGFDIRNSELFLNRLLFSADAREVLQAELKLTGLLDEIGRQLGASAPVRTLPLVQALVRLLSNEMMKQQRVARSQGSEYRLSFECAGPELQQLLTGINTRLNLDEAGARQAGAVAACIKGLRLRQGVAVTAPDESAAWATWLRVQVGGVRFELETMQDAGLIQAIVRRTAHDEALEIWCSALPEVIPLLFPAGGDGLAQAIARHSVG